ncbi:MAG: PhnD/SsuA/transferrin family substrate-binding protein [Pirellulales bacterium]
MKFAKLCIVLFLTLVAGNFSAAIAQEKGPLTLIVMDPMASKLSCDCVQGYAQRDYEKLGHFLTKKLARKVNVVWAESLKTGLEESKGAVDVIIGKHSVVLHDAKTEKLEIRPLAQLTDQKDSVNMTGMFVVRSGNPAKTVEDLKGFRVFFGPSYCDEKSAAMFDLMKQKSLPIPSPVETAPTCSAAALQLMELPEDAKAAAVISSYAATLLEGCKKVKKGDLRIIGESKPVPFITLFVRSNMSKESVEKISKAFDDVGLDAQLLIDMETASGFVPWNETESKGDKKISSR